MTTQAETRSALEPQKIRTKPRRRITFRPILRWLTIIIIFAAYAFPLYWTLTMAFKPLEEWNPPGKVFWWPENWTLANFEDILGLKETTEFFTGRSRSAIEFLVNSAVASIAGTLLAVVLGVLAAYGIARWRAGGRLLPFQVLQLRMFPPIAILIPLLFMFVYLNLWDTLWGLTLVYAAVTFPFVVWLMRSFFQEVPRELTDAAIVDGCTHWGAFFKVALPQVKGGLAATGLFVFILNWSDFLIALVMSQDNAKTAPVYLQSLQSGSAGQEYGKQAALAIILILPPAIFGLAIQKYLVRGLTFGAIKR